MIKDMVHELLKFDESKWETYAYSREPLKGKLNQIQKSEYKKGAETCGRDIAIELIDKYGILTPREYAKKLGVTVISSIGQEHGEYTMFAKFNEPSTITVFKQVVDKANELIRAEGLEKCLGNVNVYDVLVAHELFHNFECSQPEIYTNQVKIKLWSLGPYKHMSKLACLPELGAMALVKKLLNTEYSPYIFDVVFLYTYNKRKSKELFESICKLN
ncbi:hypothetical protein LL033_23720 [Clostridium estertheticum]|uniref:hypothetical protein n=1 Tax=Clostridium estertheticum TaxID=238834 RepID=UPI001C0E8A22|nr:hypothetical protein [Clostridium estertheticum]MBU3215158.1 hypothetical protein [Clostridium estertheticum]WAG55554.1 hypothetical protein LL033_23720 [Clostridium estertheticum]